MSEAAPQRALILSGGVAHDFPATSAALAGVLGEAGFEVTVTVDVEQAARDLADDRCRSTLLVLNMLRWTMQVERYAHLRAEWSISLSQQARQALTNHVRRGGGMLAMHGASICFDDWPDWRDVLGGVWRWDRSTHPPIDGPVHVTVAAGSHPIVDGIDDFDVVDEVYGFLDRAPEAHGLMSSPHGGTDHPLLWARPVGAGRVVYDALGHDCRSYQVLAHRRIVQRAARWAADGQVP